MNVYAIIITVLFIGACFLLWKRKGGTTSQLKKSLDTKEDTIRNQMLLIDKLQEKINDTKNITANNANDAFRIIEQRRRERFDKN